MNKKGCLRCLRMNTVFVIDNALNTSKDIDPQQFFDLLRKVFDIQIC